MLGIDCCDFGYRCGKSRERRAYSETKRDGKVSVYNTVGEGG